jgi:hypothetical protein
MSVTESEYFDPEKIRIRRNDQGNIILIEGDEETQVSRVVRSFPLTKLYSFISLWDEKDELGMVHRLKDLDKTSRMTLREELEKAYFMPKIKKILRIKELYGGMTWFAVETDRGYREFEILNKNSMRHMGLTRVIFDDVDGNKYEIPDVTHMDARSRSFYNWLA